ncbi:MAG: hypothetical protein QHJ81_00405 [Anaerolineae bacterium]|nr:hypothetical protein [Anaerolineae bacterium]
MAMDHGQTFGPMPGLADFITAAGQVKEDGVLLAPQTIRFFGRLFGDRHNPTVIARLNWNTLHRQPWGYQEAHTVKGRVRLLRRRDPRHLRRHAIGDTVSRRKTRP